MVEDVALRVFIHRPGGIGSEAIQLKGNPLRRGFQRTHHQRHVLVDAGVRFQIRLNVGAKSSDVGQASLVGQQFDALAQRIKGLGVAELEVAAFSFHVVVQHRDS